MGACGECPSDSLVDIAGVCIQGVACAEVLKLYDEEEFSPLGAAGVT